MLARGLAVDTIKGWCRVISRFVEFANEYPWHWRPLDVDQFLADLRSQHTQIALSTLRSYSNAISMFCSYVSDSRYEWVAFCEKQFGDVPSLIYVIALTQRRRAGSHVACTMEMIADRLRAAWIGFHS